MYTIRWIALPTFELLYEMQIETVNLNEPIPYPPIDYYGMTKIQITDSTGHMVHKSTQISKNPCNCELTFLKKEKHNPFNICSTSDTTTRCRTVSDLENVPVVRLQAYALLHSLPIVDDYSEQLQIVTNHKHIM